MLKYIPKNNNNDIIPAFTRKEIHTTTYINKKLLLMGFDKNLINKKYSDEYFSINNFMMELMGNIKYNAKIYTVNIIKDIFIYNHIIILWLNVFHKYLIKNKTTAVVSRNMGIVELFTIYNVDVSYYNVKIHNESHVNVTKLLNDVQNKYKNIKKIEYRNEMKKIYKCIIYDIYISYYYDIYNNTYDVTLQLIKQREYINCKLLEDMYNLLNNLVFGGVLVFFYPLISNNCSALLIETIFNCFTNISIYNNRRNYGYMWGNIYVCKGFKGKQRKIKHNTKYFYDFIQKLNKNNNIQNNITLLHRQLIDILLRYNPNCGELESRYLVNRHNCFLMMKKYKIETIDEPIEKKIIDIFKQIILRTDNYSRKIKVRCATIFPPNKPETTDMCNYQYAGILYDIFIHKSSKKDVKKILPYNLIYIKIQKKITNTKHYDKILSYIEKNNTHNSIKLFLSNIDFKKKDIMLYINDGLFEKYIKLYMNDNKIKHIYDTKYDKKSKCIITDICGVSDLEFYKNVVKTIKTLNNDDDLIIKLLLPINSKLKLDLVYILYCSFNTIYIDYPKSFDKCVYIYFVKHKKNISIEKINELNENDDLTDHSIIPDPYINEFKNDFIDVMNNFLCIIIIQNELIYHISEKWNVLECDKFIF